MKQLEGHFEHQHNNINNICNLLDSWPKQYLPFIFQLNFHFHMRILKRPSSFIRKQLSYTIYSKAAIIILQMTTHFACITSIGYFFDHFRDDSFSSIIFYFEVSSAYDRFWPICQWLTSDFEASKVINGIEDSRHGWQIGCL